MSEELAVVPVITPSAMVPIRMSLETVQGFEALQRAARMFAASSLVPKAYQGSIPNCVIALNIALRMQADPLMVLQSLDIIHGRPSWRATFLIAAVNNSGKYAPLRFVFSGAKGADTWGCRAISKDLKTGTPLEGAEITIAMAKSEGWYGKDGSKWKTMPEQMLMYRAASFWTRTYSPEVSMGFATTDELLDEVGASPAVETVMIEDTRPFQAPSDLTELIPIPEPDTVRNARVSEPRSPRPPVEEADPAPSGAPRPTKKGVESVKATLERIRASQTETQGSLLPDTKAPTGSEGEVK